jgi:putative FmdB family regulatory protein
MLLVRKRGTVLPLYEYRCAKCGARVEKIQKFSDPPLTTCESCGGELTRLLSAPAIQFKGTGWYITDYARKSSSQADDKRGAASKGDSGKPAEVSATPSKPADSGSSSDK